MPCEPTQQDIEDDRRNRLRLARLHAIEIRLLLLPLGSEMQSSLELVGSLLRGIWRTEKQGA